MILLLSDTPVAGTVPRLAHWIRKLSGKECHALIRRNYSHNAFYLSEGVFGCFPEWETVLAPVIRKATTLIIHNICDETFMQFIFSVKNTSSTVLYQYHSPPCEPPQYHYPFLEKYAFDAVFAVAQGHGRFREGAIAVPNIIPDFHSFLTLPKKNVLFIPHLRSRNFRWSNKFNTQDMKKLLDAKKIIDPFEIATIHHVFGRETVTWAEVSFYLQSVNMIIDDIHTGLFHQTALEALKAFCLVFSNADLYSIEEFCLAAKADSLPFIKVSNIEEIIRLLGDTSFVRSIEQQREVIRLYVQKFLGEERLARRYVDILAPYLSH